MPNSLVSAAELFKPFSYTEQHTHTHTFNTTDAHTFHCGLENNEIVWILFGVNHNLRLKLLFYAFKVTPAKLMLSLPRLWTSKGILCRKMHTHIPHTETTHTTHRESQRDAVSTMNALHFPFFKWRPVARTSAKSLGMSRARGTTNCSHDTQTTLTSVQKLPVFVNNLLNPTFRLFQAEKLVL